MASHLTTEPETARFLAEFIRYVKPQTVVETGCHEGHTASLIGQALLYHGEGRLYTCDTDPQWVERTMKECQGLPVAVCGISGRQMIEGLSEKVDVAFLDSGANLERVEEAKALQKKLSPVAWVFLHDALQTEDPCYRYICAATNWPSIVLPFGRGLAMFFVGQDRVKGPLLG